MDVNIAPAQAVRLKASMQPFTLLELQNMDLSAIEDDLAGRIQQAPQLFKNAPVVIQFPAQDIDPTTASTLIQSLRDLGFIVVGIRGEQDKQALAEALGLSLFGESSSAKSAAKKTTNAKQSKLIKQAVRSGQQLVNPDGDIVIFGNVGQGAEVLASGSIHIYGTLSGRALAGITGDQNAVISCQKYQAELVSIAGQYQTSEDLNEDHWQKTCYIQLQGEQLSIQTI